MRRNFYDVIKNGNIDLSKEYARIYELFYDTPCYKSGYQEFTLNDLIESYFDVLSKDLVGRCISLDDFNDSYGYFFYPQLIDENIDTLVDFSEYVVNFIHALMDRTSLDLPMFSSTLHHIDSCMDDVGYKRSMKENIIIYVEAAPEALAVAEITEGILSYSVLEYNHHKMKGDLVNKKNILKNMADDIEAKRGILTSINKSFSSNLFQLLNKFIRHDNSENIYISGLTDEQIEHVYDEIYQMWLLAKMQLSYLGKKDKIQILINNINQKGSIKNTQKD